MPYEYTNLMIFKKNLPQITPNERMIYPYNIETGNYKNSIELFNVWYKLRQIWIYWYW